MTSRLSACGWGVIGYVIVSGSMATRADVLISNLSEPIRSATPVGNNPNPTPLPNNLPWNWAAQSFTTDNAEYDLVSVEAVLGEGSVDPPPVVVAELHAEENGAIGAFIVTLVAPDVSGPASARTLVPLTPVILAANTTYFLVLGSQAPGDGTFEWSYAGTNDTTGSGALSSYADSQDSGANWNYGVKFPYFLQVNVTSNGDDDDDGVDDDADVCCNTPPGTAVDAAGRPIGDLDLDCDNDLADFVLFQTGITGPLTSPPACP